MAQSTQWWETQHHHWSGLGVPVGQYKQFTGFAKAKRTDSQAGRHIGRQEGRLNRERQRHHEHNSYSHNTTGWHSEKSELGSVLQIVLVSIVSFQSPAMNLLSLVQFKMILMCSETPICSAPRL